MLFLNIIQKKERHIKNQQAGFTIVELLITIIIIGFVSAGFYTFFNSSITQFFNLQRETTNLNDLAYQSQRISKVLRGLTDITAANANDLKVYAYFSPTDTYVSEIKYYRNPTNTAILADVTQMTANPPIGTPITGSLKTYTVFNNYYQVPNTNLFNYLDSAGTALTLPISDLKTIKGIRINLAVPQTNTQNSQSMILEVSLRNRKTNL